MEKAPQDSVLKYANKLFSLTVTEQDYTHVDTYFFNSQMMHQFGNANRYSRFVCFVKEDQDVFEKINAIYKQWEELQTIYFELASDDPKFKTSIQIFQYLIENHYLVSYYMAIEHLDLKEKSAWYKNEFKKLLKLSGATKEEYEEYKKSIDITEEVEGDDFYYSNKQKTGKKGVREK